MGLDMYAYVTNEEIAEVDFSAPREYAEFFYWRKHPNLQGWMERLYRKKGGRKDTFNCVPLRLDAADLDDLERAIEENRLPETSGFFFGTSDGSERPRDLEFIHRARDALNKGKRVFYFSWW